MPRKTSLLTVKTIENPKLAPGRYADGDGLYFLAEPTKPGGPVTRRRWMFFYQSPTQRRRREAGFGSFPEVGLAAARGLREAWRAQVAAGVDPIEARAADEARAAVEAAAEQAAAAAAAETFGVVADAYFAAKSPKWSDTHRRDVARILAELKNGQSGEAAAAGAVAPVRGLAGIPMTQLRKPAIRAVLDVIVARGALTYARDVVTYCRAVVKFFNAGRDDPIADPTSGLSGRDGVLPEPPAEQGHAALTAAEMPDFLRAVTGSRAGLVTRAAVRLLMLTAVRTNELRWARWPEVDFEAAVWTVPVERMKYRRRSPQPHRVPLSRQALAVLRELHAVTGERDLMLPGEQGAGRPISEARVANVIHAVGYKGRMTGHGFRSVFSTTMNERGFNPDAIERQLAHVEGNAVRDAYNRGAYWDERMRLMQAWADQLDAWEHGAKVLPLRAAV